METADGTNIWSPDIVSNKNGAGIALGENFTYQIKLNGTKLTVAIYRGDGSKSVYTDAIDPDYLGQNLYFKAGVYNQNNTGDSRSEEHTSELQSLMRISYAVFCLKKKKKHNITYVQIQQPKHTVSISHTPL